MVRTKNKSIIWKLFTKRENSLFVRCNVCHFDYKSSGNTTNLFDHIKRKHPNELQKMNIVHTKENPSSSDSENDIEDNEKKEEIPNKIKKRSTIKNYFNRDIKYSDTNKQKKNIDNAIVNMIASDLQPYSILDSQYEVPSRGKLKDTLVPNVYNKLKEQLKVILAEVKFISITSDIWTSPSNEGILTLTCHFIEDNTLRSAVLKTTQLMGSHTGAQISDAITNILTEWNVKDKVVTILSDSGSNMLNAAALLQIRHIPCFAHVLNLLVHDILKDEDECLKSVLKHCKEIVAHFKHSTLSSDKLKEKQKAANLKTLKLIQDTPIRWNSTFFMIRRILEIRQPLTLAISECDKAPLPLNASEMLLLEDLCNILKPFDEATKEISADQYVTISLIIPIIKGLTLSLQSLNNDLTSEEAKKILSICLQRVQVRFYPFETRSAVLLGTILDPRMKKLAFRQREHANNASQLLINEVTSEINRSKKNTLDEHSEGQIKPSTSQGLLGFLDELVSKQKEIGTPTSSAIIEVREYLEKPPISRSENPIEYWKNYQCNYLKQIAFKYLAVPATSVPSERVFSKAGLVMTDRRNRIKPKNLDCLIFMKSNMWLYSKQ
ncbi:unnamed protein product [Psylliodes chrysocephalus]|uniref:BED-type domain-containing protein n=1 Tax=Psylliodes chrysocephalus TaxID=3402493 RepID=A0A9P0DDI3_9CUCU|nr:unnamed protein product [Psylliodes chrysocephala]